MLNEILLSTWQTLYMVLLATLFSTLIGVPLGILLTITKPLQIWAKPWLYRLLDMIVNIGRSIPFIILLIAIIPFTRWIVGSSIGTTAAVVPLTVGAIPFIARITAQAIQEVSFGLIEAGQAMGASNWQIIKNFMMTEALPTIIHGVTLTAIALVGYSAMAGVVGGGGLGDLAIRYGYQRFDTKIMIITIVILIVMVQILQWIGNYIAEHFNRGK